MFKCAYCGGEEGPAGHEYCLDAYRSGMGAQKLQAPSFDRTRLLAEMATQIAKAFLTGWDVQQTDPDDRDEIVGASIDIAQRILQRVEGGGRDGR